MSKAFTATVSAHHSLIHFINVVLPALISIKSRDSVTVSGDEGGSCVSPSPSCESCGNSLPFKIQFLWRGLMKKSSDYQTLQLSPASFPLACCPGLPCRRPRRWGQNHQLLEATIFLLPPPSFLYPVHLGRLWFSLELSAVFPKSSFHVATSFTTIWDLQQFGPREARVSLQSWKAEPWFCVWSCGLPLLCRYLLWTSSSRSQLGKGWPIL